MEAQKSFVQDTADFLRKLEEVGRLGEEDYVCNGRGCAVSKCAKGEGKGSDGGEFGPEKDEEDTDRGCYGNE